MIGTLLLFFAFMGLLVAVLRRGRLSTLEAAERALEQFAQVIPQLCVALMAAGFLAKLIPSALIATYLGPEAGWTGLLIASVVGPIVPAGPVLAFSIAALFSRAGVPPETLVAFVTSWSLFTLHRMVTYELPLLGVSFLKLRLLSVGFVPIAAGLLAALIVRVF
ncbi:MAG: hypothetical protein ACK4GC_01730 [Paracoccaceae bacterium]